MSAVTAPSDASGMVLRQNGISSWIDTGVGLFSPITLNWVLGRSCADAPPAEATPVTAAAKAKPANHRCSMFAPLVAPHRISSEQDARQAGARPDSFVACPQTRQHAAMAEPIDPIVFELFKNA